MAALEVYLSYAHEDQVWCKRVVTALMELVRRDVIHIWLDAYIQPGKIWGDEVKANLEKSSIIVLLISPDFIASNFCWNVEMPLALARHQDGNARIIPIIVRPTNWQKTPLHDLQVFPTNGMALSTLSDQDSALLNIANEIEKIVNEVS